MPNPLSVTELNSKIKALIESYFGSLYVCGEVGNLTYHSSGHIYFSLKDETSKIGCAMWRSSAASLKFRLEEGQKIIINGELSIYPPRGEYKLICKKITPDGIGALMLAYEQLKGDLARLGYFDESIKKQLPRFPKHIAIITSATGAALQDMLRVANKRWRLLKITVLDSAVQGEEAKTDIARNIKVADSLGCDIIVLSRGGGSLEDLWAFNEKVVADAIYSAKTPIVSAVGHEVDYLISDFVADLRAPTPSAAMEMILPDMNEALMSLDELEERMEQTLKRSLLKKLEAVQELKDRLRAHNIDIKLNSYKEMLKELQKRFNMHIEAKLISVQTELKSFKSDIPFHAKRALSSKQTELLTLQNYYIQSDPKKRVKKGFVEISFKGKRVELGSLKKDDSITLSDGAF
ncbi:MAG: exodeoxyribonuclease VII large subunit, partial [Campylobacterales bacterium]